MVSKKNAIDQESAPPGDRALIVHPVLPAESRNKDQQRRLDYQMEEARGLAAAIGLEITDVIAVNVSRIQPGYLLGKGGRERVAEAIAAQEPDIVIVNHNLSPVQQRNLEREWNSKVIDRTGLILEIFGARARTREGKIQVELAALEYQSSRLVRSWTHLERQRGGAGFMGGPGETQIEMDRRIIGDRIVKLKKDLEDVRRTRDLARKSRERVPYPVVALVGYTNAGKSTLFNRMTGAGVFAEDLLFATLDPTMRKLKLKSGQEIILSDTVGFISDLPTHLVAAFRATLEQVQYADIILHVRDIASADSAMQKEEVVKILGDLGIAYEQDGRVYEVLNKIDVLDSEEKQDILRKSGLKEHSIALSALTGEGLEILLDAIETVLSAKRYRVRFLLKPADGQALAWLYRHANIFDRSDETGHITVYVEIDPADLGRFYDRFSYEPEYLDESQKTVYGL